MYYQSSMQIETSNPEGKRKMPETRLTSFRHYPLVRELRFLGLHRRLLTDYFFLTYYWKIRTFYIRWDVGFSCISSRSLPFFLLFYNKTANISLCFVTIYVYDGQCYGVYVTFVKKKKKLTSIFVSHVSCSSLWARQKFLAP